MNRIADRLAEDGYTCVSINYRLAPKHRFPAQIEDCRAAVAWMRAHQDKLKLDPKRIAGFGYSAGGHLVSLLATADVLKDEPDTRLQCVVAGGAPCDFRPLPAKWDFLAYWLGGTREANPEAYELASPMKYVTADDPPAFFYHGEEDKLVPRFSPEQMVESLKKAGVDASIYLVPKAGHIEAFFSDDAVGKAISFLNLQLKGVPAKQ
jgi:acetyl esterase/lipase